MRQIHQESQGVGVDGGRNPVAFFGSVDGLGRSSRPLDDAAAYPCRCRRSSTASYVGDTSGLSEGDAAAWSISEQHSMHVDARLSPRTWATEVLRGPSGKSRAVPESEARDSIYPPAAAPDFRRTPESSACRGKSSQAFAAPFSSDGDAGARVSCGAAQVPGGLESCPDQSRRPVLPSKEEAPKSLQRGSRSPSVPAATPSAVMQDMPAPGATRPSHEKRTQSAQAGDSRSDKLPAALEERYRVLRKLGSGVYGDVYVCAFVGDYPGRNSDVNNAAASSRENGSLLARSYVETVSGGGVKATEELKQSKTAAPLFAIKRVRLPTSKLKSLFGMEQQVLRELTVLRGLNHVNVLKLEAFYFELEPWDRSGPFRAALKRITSDVRREKGQNVPGVCDKEARRRDTVSEKNGADRGPGADGFHAQGSESGITSAQLRSFREAVAKAERESHSESAFRRFQEEAVAAHEAAMKRKLRPEQLYRPTVYMIFELCDCDLAKFADMRYKAFLDFWRSAGQRSQAQTEGAQGGEQFCLGSTSSEDAPPLPGVTEPEAQLIAYQLFQGLAYCHSRGVLHRDVKSQNVMMLRDVGSDGTEHWVAKLGDFGLACCTHSADSSRTEEVVTLLYRAPELLLGRTDYDAAVDVWSMAIVIIEIMVGRPPFKARNDIDMLARIVKCVGCSAAKELLQIAPNRAALESVLPHITKATEQPKLKQLLTDQFGRQLLSDEGLDFLTRLMEVNPAKRLTAAAALQHPWLRPVLDRFPNKDAYIQPQARVQLPPSFLAVDPLAYSCYALQQQSSSRADIAMEGQPLSRASSSSLSCSGKSPYQADLKVSDLCSNACSTLSVNETENRRRGSSVPLLMPWDEAPPPRSQFDVHRGSHVLAAITPRLVTSIYRRCGLGTSHATRCQGGVI